ncbi:MAG: hypothetical protein ACTHOP_14220 [Mesorhizobium sp.]
MKAGRGRQAAGGTVGLSILLLGCLLTAGGCVRTPDGTVAVAEELDVGRYWRPRIPPPQTPPVQSGTEVFPVAPTTGWSRPARRPHRTTHKSRPAKSGPAKSETARVLACHNEVLRGQRARVVCE